MNSRGKNNKSLTTQSINTFNNFWKPKTKVIKIQKKGNKFCLIYKIIIKLTFPNFF